MPDLIACQWALLSCFVLRTIKMGSGYDCYTDCTVVSCKSIFKELLVLLILLVVQAVQPIYHPSQCEITWMERLVSSKSSIAHRSASFSYVMGLNTNWLVNSLRTTSMQLLSPLYLPQYAPDTVTKAGLGPIKSLSSFKWLPIDIIPSETSQSYRLMAYSKRSGASISVWSMISGTSNVFNVIPFIIMIPWILVVNHNLAPHWHWQCTPLIYYHLPQHAYNYSCSLATHTSRNP